MRTFRLKDPFKGWLRDTLFDTASDEIPAVYIVVAALFKQSTNVLL